MRQIDAPPLFSYAFPLRLPMTHLPTLHAHPSTAESGLGLLWLLRLRWVAVAGQIVALLVAAFPLRIILPLEVLVPCVTFTLLSNWMLWLFRERLVPWARLILPGLIAVDIAVLTLMLYFAGGAHNPFTMLYLLHTTLAVMLLPGWMAWATVGLCAAGFGILFNSDHALVRIDGGTCCDDMTAHLQGMLLGMVVTGAGVAYFVGRLDNALGKQRREAAEAHARGERQERLASLATLAGGVAHELATPLATIDVAAREMSRNLQRDGSRESEEDAVLIQEQVERCKRILARLNLESLQSGMEAKEADFQEVATRLAEFLDEPHDQRVRLEGFEAEGRLACAVEPLAQSLLVVIHNALMASETDQPVWVRASMTQDQAVFEVQDHGIGMKAEILEKVGEPFFTTKQPGSGMGLGLYLVRMFCESTGATLEFESQSGKGTLARLKVPMVEAGLRV